MVGFYYLGCLGSALHDVRVNGSLGQELDSLQLSGLLLKHADEFSTDNLTLLFRICLLYTSPATTSVAAYTSNQHTSIYHRAVE